MSQSIIDNRSLGNNAPVAHQSNYREAINEIHIQLENLGYTEEEWNHDFYSKFMITVKNIREIVKETKK